MSSSRILYTPRPNATPESESNMLAAVYRFTLDCHAKKNAAGVTSTNGGEAKGSKHDRPNGSIP